MESYLLVSSTTKAGMRSNGEFYRDARTAQLRSALAFMARIAAFCSLPPPNPPGIAPQSAHTSAGVIDCCDSLHDEGPVVSTAGVHAALLADIEAAGRLRVAPCAAPCERPILGHEFLFLYIRQGSVS